MTTDTYRKARGRLAIQHPFYAAGMMALDVVWTDQVPVAGTDMKHLYINEAAIKGWSTEELMFLLAHETLHYLLQHGLRQGTRHAELWNVACDFAINDIIVQAGLPMPSIGGLHDVKYRGMSAEAVYEALLEEGKGKGNGQGNGSGQGDCPSNPMPGDVMVPAGAGDTGSREQMSRRAKQSLAQAATIARAAGKMSAGLEAAIGEVLDPQVPWEVLLRDYLTRAAKDDESWARRNRRFQDIYLPRRHSQKMGPIVFIPDTSGSMWSGDTLQVLCSEIAHCQQSMNPENIRVVWADAEVKGEQVFEADEFSHAMLKPVGGGGTDMRVPLAHVEQYEPQVVILLPDGETPWPAVEPPYDLITVCTTEAPVPFGLTVRVKTR